ncbi:MAG: hypothetical protein SFU21_13285, partial [Flavihumibacter sp.]|nr:hypothetical protein [Flavihumibacter sp.]
DINWDEKVKEVQSSAKSAADQTKNFKSIVTDLIGGRYYQALVNNGMLTNTNSDVKIKSTIYGLIRVFDSTRREQEYFRQLRWARNTQIGLGAKIEKDNKISAFNTSLTIALLNKREYSDKENLFGKNNLAEQEIQKSTVLIDTKVIPGIEAKINNELLSQTSKEELIKKYEKLFIDFNKSDFDFSLFKEFLNDSEIKSLKDGWGALTKKYDAIQKKLSGAPLLTFTYDGDYTGTKWTKLNNKMEFIVGFGNKKDSLRKYDFYAGAFYNNVQDTLNLKQSLNRRSFSTKVGVNAVVWKDKQDGSSIVEAFGGTEFSHINKGIYPGEKKNNFKFDLTLSFRLAKNLYLPFQLKYNATSGRFEGYLDLKFDVVNIFK